MLSFPCASKGLLLAVYGMIFFEWMNYTEDLTFDQCQGNNGKIYESIALGKEFEKKQQLFITRKHPI